MLELRPFQDGLINNVKTAFRQHRRVLLQSPTGSGKTVMFSAMARRATDKAKNTLILVHREELLEQVSDTLADFHLRHGCIAANYPKNYRYPVQVASVFTLIRRLDDIQPPDFIIVDEAHHCIKGTTWGKVIQAYENAHVLGVSATPERLSGEGLGEVFSKLIQGPPVRWLIDQGYLSDYRMYSPPGVDITGVHSRAGDYAKSELEGRIDKPKITGDVITHYRRYAHNKPAVAFCVSVLHAQHVCQRFRDAGYQSVAVDGGMDKELRREIMRDFRNGKIDVLTSCDLISEGFDVPGIEAAILLRPTQSLAIYLQQVGRALRAKQGKEYAVILDHANNWRRHGFPDMEREWSLAGRPKGLGSGEGGVQLAHCPECFAVMEPGTKSCVYCETELTGDSQGRTIQEVEGELIQIKKEEMEKRQAQVNRRREQGQARTMDELIELGESRGYKNPRLWAEKIYESRAR